MNINQFGLQIPNSVGRRGFLAGTAAGAASVIAAACAPAPAPPSAQPAGPAASGKAAWEAEWERTVAAAKQEGEVVLATITGPGYRKVADAFEEAFPGIKVQHTGWASFNQFTPKILQERAAGIYAWDVTAHVADVHLNEGTLRPAGALDPVRPAIIRGDVLDDKAWEGGFEAGWLDNEKQLGYGFLSALGGRTFWASTDLVNEGEIKSVQDLLNPKWKGKMIFADPRISGHTYYVFTAIRLNLGKDDIMKQVFVDQAPVLTRDPRQIAEGVVRGKYALTAVTNTVMSEFRTGELASKVRVVALPEAEYESFSTGVWLINRAPHPNAAKVFINWLLTKDGQTAWNKHLVTNSRRFDTPPGDPDNVLPKGKAFKVKIGKEDMNRELRKTQDLATELLK